MPERNQQTSPWKVLIVEDEVLLLEMYQIAFKSAGFSVRGALTGQAGWQELQAIKQKTDIDLVLLDIKMDDLSGIEILRRAKQDSLLKRIPIWMLTNVGEELVAREAVALGAEEYIMKTKIIPSELVAKVKERLIKGRPLLKKASSFKRE